jgi:alpha-glucuronidase
MPGPKSYQRNHAEGANMLAKALKPHGGYLIWRAFVYGRSKDRVNDLYNEFNKLDGQFDDNVILQIKNGPLDFQPREPASTLFGAMPRTNLSLELQVTKEYLGHATTLCYLGPSWEEILQYDTYAEGEGSTVAKVIDGTVSKPHVTCIAGVANTGRDADWCGSVFNQANWYLYGRLAWNPQMRSAAIADEWIRMTFNCSDDAHRTIRTIMGMSYEATVNYMMPLGLCILVDGRTHYKPKTRGREHYHHGSKSGIGVNRTTSGSNHVAQYPEPLRSRYNNMETTPLKYLLFFTMWPGTRSSRPAAPCCRSSNIATTSGWRLLTRWPNRGAR